jgi:hypothetical protein
MPNFFIVGAAKAGTSSLYQYLRQHSQVYLSYPVKEPNFFAFDGEIIKFNGLHTQAETLPDSLTSLVAYEELFKDSMNYPARGEASTLYLYCPGTAERIRSLVPDAKLIVVLRQPADRAYSHYIMMVRSGREWLSFEEALEQERTRIEQSWSPTWHYRETGYYHEQL